MSLDRYEIVSELGAGKCGQSFLARDKHLPSNRLCVIKQLKPRTNDPETYKLIKERFIVEARILEKLGKVSDQIPELYELIIQEEDIYLVQEWVEGKTLTQKLQDEGPLSVGEVKDIVHSVLSILNLLYFKGVIHRDINPNNIILRQPDGKPVLIDFGVVKEVLTTVTDLHGTSTNMSIVAGTNGYMSPEQTLGYPVFASDLYSLGMTAIHLLTNKHPLELMDPSREEIQWQKYAPNVPHDFALILTKATQSNRFHRYTNAKEMLDELLPLKKQISNVRTGENLGSTDLTNSNENKEIIVEVLSSEGSTSSPTSAKQFSATKKAEDGHLVTSQSQSPHPQDVQESPSDAPLAGINAEINLAIDFGNHQTLIYREDHGIVVSEPSIVIINKATKAVEAIGENAGNFLLNVEGLPNSTSNTIAYHPIEDGKVADSDLAEKMLQHFIHKACGNKTDFIRRVVITIPSELTQVERSALVDAAYSTRVGEVYLAERIICAAIGTGLPIKELNGSMVIHVGESTTEIIAISYGGRSTFKAVNVANDFMKESITQYLKRKYSLLIGEDTAEDVKREIGSAFPLDEPLSLKVRGRNLIEGIPKTITIDDQEIREALAYSISMIVDATRATLERTPPQLSADIVERGIILTGVGATLKKLDLRLQIETGLPVSVATEPLSAVLLGAIRQLSGSNLRREKRPSQPQSHIITETLTKIKKSAFNLLSYDLAIDIGTNNTLIYAKKRGIVVAEPSIVAINKTTNTVEAVGHDAREMIGRSHSTMVAIHPMKDGVITNSEVAGKMLEHFIQAAHNGVPWVSPRIVIPIRSDLTKVERQAFIDSAYRANAFEVYLVEDTMAAAIGSGLPVTEPRGNMIINIGAGTTEIAVVSLSGVVYERFVRVAGNEMDEAITQFIKRKYNLLIGERTAERIKIELGSAFPLDEPLSMEIRGRNIIEGIPKTVTITDDDIREALADPVSIIVNSVRVALERTPPELSADIIDRGIVLAGGGALLKNLDRRLSIETGLPISLAEDPLSCVVLGTAKMLSDFYLLKRLQDSILISLT